MIDEAVAWIPPMDVYEMDNDYIVNAELAGIEASDIQMEFSNSGFTIRGERGFGTVCECERESYDRLELHRGRFQRTFPFPERVDGDRIQWHLKDGVLHVVIPKTGQTGSR
jgi:HSP20 family protein